MPDRKYTVQYDITVTGISSIYQLNEAVSSLNKNLQRTGRTVTEVADKFDKLEKSSNTLAESLGRLNNRLNSAVENFNRFNGVAGTAINTTNNLNNTVNNTTNNFNRYNTTLSQTNNYQTTLNNTATTANHTFNNYSTTVNRTTASFANHSTMIVATTRNYYRFGAASSHVAKKQSELSRLLKFTLLYHSAYRLYNAIVEASNAGVELEKRIAEIRTITIGANVSTEAWRHNLRQLSNDMGIDILETARGTYQALSNQVTNAAGAVNFMQKGLLFAKVTVSDSSDAIDLLSSALNSYHDSAIRTTEVSAKLFAAIDLGRMTAETMAQVIGPSLNMAAALNIKLEEVLASAALLTQQGTKTETALTLTRNVISALAKPSKEMKELFAEWGVNSAEAAINTFGFAGVLRKLGHELQTGGLTRLNELARDMRELIGITSLTRGEGKLSFDELVKQISNSEANYAAAQKEIMQTSAQAFEQVMARIKNVVTVDYGTIALEKFLTLNETLGGFEELAKDVADIMVSFGDSLIVVTSVLGGLNTAIKTISVGTIDLGDAITYAATAFYTLRAAAIAAQIGLGPFWAFVAGIGALTVGAAAIISMAVGKAERQLREEINETRTLLEKRASEWSESEIAAYKKVEKVHTEYMDSVMKLTNRGFAAARQAYSAIIASFGDDLEEAKGKVEDLKKDAESSWKAATERINNMMTKALVGDSFTKNIAHTRGEIQALMQTAFSSNNIEQFIDYFEQAKGKAQDLYDFIEKAVNKQKDALKNAQDSLVERKFESTLDGKSTGQKATLIKQEVENLRNQAAGAIAAGEFEKAEEHISRAESLTLKLHQTVSSLADKYREAGLAAPAVDFTLDESLIRLREQMVNAMTQELQTQQTMEQNSLWTHASINQYLDRQLKFMEALVQKQEDLNKKQEEMNQMAAEAQKRRKQLNDANIQANLDAQTALSKSAGYRVDKAMAFRGSGDTASNSLQSPEIRDAFNLARKSEAVLKHLQEDAPAETIKKYADAYGKAYNLLTIEAKNKDIRLTDNGQEYVKSLDETRKALQALYESRANLEKETPELNLIESKLKEASDLVVNQAKTHFKSLFDQITADMVKPLDTAAVRLQTMINQLHATPINKVPGFAVGGMFRGPAGVDRGMARLTDQEYVVNSRAAPRWLPLLNRINSNRGPSVVNNYSLNTTVEAGDTNAQTARSIGAELYRGMKRGTIRKMS